MPNESFDEQMKKAAAESAAEAEQVAFEAETRNEREAAEQAAAEQARKGDGDLLPNEVEYVRNKVATMDLAAVQALRAKETKLPFVEGGRPSALRVMDERIAQLQQEG